MTATATKDDVVDDDLKKQSQLDEEKTQCSNKERFELELEFVQSLANPRYLHHLATTPCSSSSPSNSLKADDNDNNNYNNDNNVDLLMGGEMVVSLVCLLDRAINPTCSDYM